VVHSEDGARMGCVLGSFGFCLASQDIYEAVQDTYAQSLRCVVNDINVMVPPQLNTRAQLEQCVEIFYMIEREAWARAELKLNQVE